MKSLENLCRAFYSAWDMMIDVPLPECRDNGYFYENNFLTSVMIPAVGAVPGILLAALGTVLDKSVAGSILWAFAAVIVSELITSGRAGKFVADSLTKLIFRQSSECFVNSVVTFLMLFKLAAFYLISYSGNTGFAVLLFVLVFAFEMYLVTFPEKNAILALEPEDMHWALYLFPAVVVFLWFWSFPPAVLSSAAAVYGVAVLFRKRVWQEDHVISADDVTLCAGCAEFAILICAIIFLG